MTSFTDSWVLSAESSIKSLIMPAASHAFFFIRVYVTDAGSSPTRITDSLGATPLSRLSFSTC